MVDLSAFGTSTDDIRDGVVVQNGRITAAGPRRSTVVPRGAEVIDATGTFIVKRIDRVMLAGALIYRAALLHAGR